MSKFKCSICGFVYDEAAGWPEKGIAPGTKWEDIPDDFVCPLCGAPKSVFEKAETPQQDRAAEPSENVVKKVTASPTKVSDGSEKNNDVEGEDHEDLRELSVGELSALFSNLAKGCERQYLVEEMGLFNQLADYYKSKMAVQKGVSLDDATKLLDADLSDGFAKANAAATKKADRGALRALVWSEKVSRIVKSLLDRYAREGNAMLENTKIYVCDICGFVYIGDTLPQVCPICKVPNFKMSQVGRR